MDRDDAEQVAMIGLIEAAKRFDPDLGYQFSTYAFYWIRQACQRHGLLYGLPIHIPDNLFWHCNRLDLTEEELQKRHGLAGAAWRMAEEIEQTGGTVPEFWTYYRLARHLKRAADLPHHQRIALNPCDQPTDPADLARAEEQRQAIIAELDKLDSREALVLRKRYGFGGPEQTLEEVAGPLNLTRERIRQLQVRAETLLRERLRKRGFGLSGNSRFVQPENGVTGPAVTNEPEPECPIEEAKPKH
jgi:RNA polymerase sigma factor (sigma-70 family)